MTGQSGRSTFVTLIAWASIALGGLGALVTGFQNILFFTILPLKEIEKAIQGAPDTDRLERVFSFMLSISPFVLPGFFIVSLAGLMAGLGLLKRRDWGRRILVGVLSLGVFWNVGGLIFQQIVIWTTGQQYAGPGPSWISSMATVLVSIFSGAFTLLLIGFLGWLIWFLMSDRVKVEFNSDGE